MAWLTQLPPLMFTIISKERSAEINMEVESQHHLTEQQGDGMMQMIKNIITKKVIPGQLLEKLKQEIGLKQEASKALALDLLGRRFLPMQWYIGNVEGLIKDLGGEVEKYVAEARKNYPEVYAPEAKTSPALTQTQTAIKTSDDLGIFHDIDETLTSTKGRAGLLLKLTGLSQEIEVAAKQGKFNETEGAELLRGLDALSYAVNTKDLNPLEIVAIKRKLKSILAKVNG